MPAHRENGSWGIFGGTFDPVHIGHLTLAREIKQKAHLTGILFVPSFKHPFKHAKCFASFKHRYNMLNLAKSGAAEFALSGIEHESGMTGYTLDTVKALKASYPMMTFRFVIGADNLPQLSSWYRPDELLAEITFLVGTRPGHEFILPEGLPKDRFEIVDTTPTDVSSTMIRRELQEETRENVVDLLPSGVWAYIEKHGLYQ